MTDKLNHPTVVLDNEYVEMLINAEPDMEVRNEISEMARKYKENQQRLRKAREAENKIKDSGSSSVVQHRYKVSDSDKKQLVLTITTKTINQNLESSREEKLLNVISKIRKPTIPGNKIKRGDIKNENAIR